jgi:hypothetical protein
MDGESTSIVLPRALDDGHFRTEVDGQFGCGGRATRTMTVGYALAVRGGAMRIDKIGYESADVSDGDSACLLDYYISQ